jgi:hypothetical protein
MLVSFPQRTMMSVTLHSSLFSTASSGHAWTEYSFLPH